MEEEIFKIFKDTRSFDKDGNLCRGALWEVSNLGSVRKNGEEILPYEGSGKYLHFGHHFKLHRAVGELFIPNPEHKKTIDHINRNRQDNRASNLRWATPKEQAENRDNDAIRKSLIGNKRSLGYKHSEETRRKMGAAHLGNKNTLGFSPSEETRAKISKYVSNTVWIIHPMTNDRKRVPKEQLPEYLDKGYIKGKKIKK